MKIEITVGPDSFAFRSPRRSLVLKTIVHVVREGDTYMVVGFSDTSHAEGDAVPLFGNPCELPNHRPKLLLELLKHGILHHRADFWLLKPVVVFNEVRSLDPILHGYQEALLEPLAIEAGARTVVFAPGQAG